MDTNASNWRHKNPVCDPISQSGTTYDNILGLSAEGTGLEISSGDTCRDNITEDAVEPFAATDPDSTTEVVCLPSRTKSQDTPSAFSIRDKIKTDETIDEDTEAPILHSMNKDRSALPEFMNKAPLKSLKECSEETPQFDKTVCRARKSTVVSASKYSATLKTLKEYAKEIASLKCEQKLASNAHLRIPNEYLKNKAADHRHTLISDTNLKILKEPSKETEKSTREPKPASDQNFEIQSSKKNSSKRSTVPRKSTALRVASDSQQKSQLMPTVGHNIKKVAAVSKSASSPNKTRPSKISKRSQQTASMNKSASSCRENRAHRAHQSLNMETDVCQTATTKLAISLLEMQLLLAESTQPPKEIAAWQRANRACTFTTNAFSLVKENIMKDMTLKSKNTDNKMHPSPTIQKPNTKMERSAQANVRHVEHTSSLPVAKDSDTKANSNAQAKGSNTNANSNTQGNGSHVENTPSLLVAKDCNTNQNSNAALSATRKSKTKTHQETTCNATVPAVAEDVGGQDVVARTPPRHTRNIISEKKQSKEQKPITSCSAIDYDKVDRDLATQLSDIKRDIHLYAEELKRLQKGFAEEDLLGVHIPSDMSSKLSSKISYLNIKLKSFKDQKKELKKQQVDLARKRLSKNDRKKHLSWPGIPKACSLKLYPVLDLKTMPASESKGDQNDEEVDLIPKLVRKTRKKSTVLKPMIASPVQPVILSAGDADNEVEVARAVQKHSECNENSSIEKAGRMEM